MKQQTNWDKEKGISPDTAGQYKQTIHDFISDRTKCMAYFMSRRKDGREIMRPVSTIVDNWIVHTMTQDVQPKTKHVQNDPIVGYLWVGHETRDEGIYSYPDKWNPKVVWMQGTVNLIKDQTEVNLFYKMREKKYGRGRAHPPDETLYLMKTTPQYVRAEGWHDRHAIVYKDF